MVLCFFLAAGTHSYVYSLQNSPSFAWCLMFAHFTTRTVLSLIGLAGTTLWAVASCCIHLCQMVNSQAGSGLHIIHVWLAAGLLLSLALLQHGLQHASYLWQIIHFVRCLLVTLLAVCMLVSFLVVGLWYGAHIPSWQLSILLVFIHLSMDYPSSRLAHGVLVCVSTCRLAASMLNDISGRHVSFMRALFYVCMAFQLRQLMSSTRCCLLGLLLVILLFCYWYFDLLCSEQKRSCMLGTGVSISMCGEQL